MAKVDLFSVKLGCYENNNSEIHKSILNLAHSLEKSNEGNKFSNKGGFQSKNLDIVGDVKDFVEFFLNPCFEAYLKDDFLFSEARLHIKGMWANINYKYSYNIPHVHPGSDFAFVYYAKVPENSGDLVFNHPSESIVHHDFFITDKQIKCTPVNAAGYVLRPKEKCVYFFPSYLTHSVSQSMSEEKRITVAGNLSVDIV